MKSDSDDHDWRANVPLLKAEGSEEQRIAYAAAMIPREPDKEGDVASTPTVEKAAHNFLKQNGGVDTDHSLIDGEGEPVESWVLKEDTTFDLPGGGEETYPRGTWMLGIKWDAEPWERIKSGELTGLSIYGMAEHVSLSAKDCDCGDAANRPNKGATKSKVMGQDYDYEAMAEELAEPLAESLGDSVASNVSESVKDALPEDTFAKQDDVTELINEFVDQLADLDEVEREAPDIRDDIQAALTEPEEKQEDEDMEDEEEDDEEEMESGAGESEAAETEATEKSAEEEANLSKGTDARQTAAKGIDAEPSGSGSLSYAAAAEKYEGDN